MLISLVVTNWWVAAKDAYSETPYLESVLCHTASLGQHGTEKQTARESSTSYLGHEFLASWQHGQSRKYQRLKSGLSTARSKKYHFYSAFDFSRPIFSDFTGTTGLQFATYQSS